MQSLIEELKAKIIPCKVISKENEYGEHGMREFNRGLNYAIALIKQHEAKSIEGGFKLGKEVGEAAGKIAVESLERCRYEKEKLELAYQQLKQQQPVSAEAMACLLDIKWQSTRHKRAADNKHLLIGDLEIIEQKILIALASMQGETQDKGE